MSEEWRLYDVDGLVRTSTGLRASLKLHLGQLVFVGNEQTAIRIKLGNARTLYVRELNEATDAVVRAHLEKQIATIDGELDRL